MSSAGLSHEPEERRPVRNPKGGRPRIEEQLGDPTLAPKAQGLRAKGLSWSKIAERLGIGRTTVRRLCQKCPNRSSGEVIEQNGVLVAQTPEPFWNSTNSLPKPGKEDDVKLPKVCPTCGQELPED